MRIYCQTTHAKSATLAAHDTFEYQCHCVKLKPTLLSCTCVYAAWLSSLMDPCSSSNICDSCHEHATCKALNGSNSACYCELGYTGDGTTFCNGKYRCTNPTVDYSLFKI